MNRLNKKRKWIVVDFFRGFFAAFLFILLCLLVLFGVHTAQTSTERVCFGENGAVSFAFTSSETA